MAASPTSAADSLVRAADKAGENTARSSMDATFKDFQLPTDPSALGRMYGDVADDLYQNLGIGGALEQSEKLTEDSGMADAAAVFENRIKGEELGKTPVSELDSEIDRLSEQRWGILPAVLGRTDIIDYGAKLKIATRATDILDGEINRLTKSRERIVTAAENRAKDRVEGLKAEAALLDKRSTAAQNDLRSRIDLFKEGRATFDDVVQAALELKKMNDEKAKGSGDGNPFLGLPGQAAFTPAEISAFQYFESFGDWPVTDSSKLQLKQQLTQRYTQWKSSGSPGLTKAPTPTLQDPSIKTGSDYYKSMSKPQVGEPIENPFQPVADSQNQSAKEAMAAWAMSLSGVNP